MTNPMNFAERLEAAIVHEIRDTHEQHGVKLETMVKPALLMERLRLNVLNEVVKQDLCGMALRGEHVAFEHSVRKVAAASVENTFREYFALASAQ